MPGYPFFVVGRGAVPLGQLGIGTQIMTRAGPALVIASLVRHEYPQGIPVYNFEVEGDHTYFVGKADGGLWVHNNCQDELDLDKEWRFHYSNEPNLSESGLRPGSGNDKVFVTDLLPDNATPEATSALTGAGPLKYGYPVDVTGLNVEDAGSGFSNGASDEFIRGTVPPDRVLAPYTLF